VTDAAARAALVASVRAEVAARHPRDGRESWSVRRTLAMLDWLPAPLDEHADPVHVTGSAVVLDTDGRVLLHHHKRLRRWLQPGGHVDPGEHPAATARRETLEETGIDADHDTTGPQLIHVDVHEGPRGHVHLDLRYLLRAERGLLPDPGPGESPHVDWFGPAAASARADVSLRAALDAAWAHTARTARRPGEVGQRDATASRTTLTTPRGGPR